MERYDVAIVGAGHGGAQAAVVLRQKGFAGSIALIGDEPLPPYERPPLSKEYLSGAKTFERILLRPATYWAERDISLLLGTPVAAVDAAARVLRRADGRTIGYGELIWAAGGQPRRLQCEGHHLPGIHHIRTRADIDGILADLPATRRVAIVGGGYIGLEAAAALRKLGHEVVLVEALDRVLARVAGVEVSRFFEAEHRAHGVDLRLGQSVAGISEAGGRASGLILQSGEHIAADMVIVGIGIIPAVEPLRAAGAVVGNGVEVDSFCRTSLPHIHAIGDCAAHVNRFADGARIRLESVQNANDMATTAALDILGTPKPYAATPWFWSNQYDLKLQTVGLSTGHEHGIVRGDPASRSFSVLYVRNGRVAAVDCINAMKDYVEGRKLVEAGTVADPAMADPAIPLRAERAQL